MVVVVASLAVEARTAKRGRGRRGGDEATRRWTTWTRGWTSEEPRVVVIAKGVVSKAGKEMELEGDGVTRKGVIVCRAGQMEIVEELVVIMELSVKGEVLDWREVRDVVRRGRRRRIWM